MVVRLEHDMLLSSKMRIYIITHINNVLLADTPHNHGGLTNGYKKGGAIICSLLKSRLWKNLLERMNN